MLFSDEMATLSERFREMTVTLAAPAPLPPNLPARMAAAGDGGLRRALRRQRLPAQRHDREIAAAFPAARNVEAEPMPLRAIFLAIAKSARTGAAERSANRPRRREEASMNQTLHIFKKTPGASGPRSSHRCCWSRASR